MTLLRRSVGSTGEGAGDGERTGKVCFFDSIVANEAPPPKKSERTHHFFC